MLLSADRTKLKAQVNALMLALRADTTWWTNTICYMKLFRPKRLCEIIWKKKIKLAVKCRVLFWSSLTTDKMLCVSNVRTPTDCLTDIKANWTNSTFLCMKSRICVRFFSNILLLDTLMDKTFNFNDMSSRKIGWCNCFCKLCRRPHALRPKITRRDTRTIVSLVSPSDWSRMGMQTEYPRSKFFLVELDKLTSGTRSSSASVPSARTIATSTPWEKCRRQNCESR